MNRKQKLTLLAMDILLLAELTFAVYLAQQHKEVAAAIFLRHYIPMCLTTLLAAKVLIRRFRDPELMVLVSPTTTTTTTGTTAG